MPAPITPPTTEWVVETGAPIHVARLTHRADDAGIAHRLGSDDALGNGVDHVAAGDQRACALEDCGDDESARQCQRLRAHGGTDIVGNVVGTDVERHVGADGGSGDDDDGARLADHDDGGENRSDSQKEQAEPGRHQTAGDEARRLLHMDEFVEILVERLFSGDCGIGHRQAKMFWKGGHSQAARFIRVGNAALRHKRRCPNSRA
jgi:hypothetical protein